jgi:FKBP-type peptidyl-prolyl cis-trans isomerase
LKSIGLFLQKKQHMKLSFSTTALRWLLLLVLSSTGLFTTACKKDDKDYTQIDEDIIKKYIADNGISTAQRQSSGLYYVPITAAPAGIRAVAGRTVSVLYTGMLMDGTVFDASSRHGNTPISFKLGTGRVIAGWDEGIALMRKGEKGQLLIPSALAYGDNSPSAAIPSNAVLRFEVELVDVM